MKASCMSRHTRFCMKVAFHCSYGAIQTALKGSVAGRGTNPPSGRYLVWVTVLVCRYNMSYSERQQITTRSVRWQFRLPLNVTSQVHKSRTVNSFHQCRTVTTDSTDSEQQHSLSMQNGTLNCQDGRSRRFIYRNRPPNLTSWRRNTSQ